MKKYFLIVCFFICCLQNVFAHNASSLRAIALNRGEGYEIVLNENISSVRVVSSELFYEKLSKQEPRFLKKGKWFSLFLMSQKDLSTLFLTHHASFSEGDISRDLVWQKRLELGSLFEELSETIGCKENLYATILPVITAVHRLNLGKEISEKDIYTIFFRNSQKIFDRKVDACLNDQGAANLDAYFEKGPLNEQYFHTDLFSYLYAQEIKLIKKLLEEERNKKIKVLDLGTGGGSFILSAAHVLSAEELARIEFVGIDLGGRDALVAEKMFQDIPEATIEFVIDDIEELGFINRLSSYNADLIVVNHVLEHLKRPVLDFLHQWVLSTNSYLAVSVPLEEDLEKSVSDHCHSFTAESLINIANTLEERINHTAFAVDLQKTSRLGLWIFQKDRKLLKKGDWMGKSFTITPQTIQVNNHPIYEDFQTPFDVGKYNRVQRALKVAEIQDKLSFSKQGQKPRQVRQLLIKMPGTVMHIPEEFSQFKEALQLIVNHNRAVNPKYNDYYAYLNIFRGITRHDSYRGLSLTTHGDQMQTLRKEYAYNPDYSYIASNTLPTTLYLQAFDFSEVVRAFEEGEKINLYNEMKKQARPENSYYTDNYGIYLLSPYIVHSATYTPVDVERVFIKVAFSSKRFYDNREERRNPCFDYEDWFEKETLGYTDGWLQHAHCNERFIKEDIIEE